MKRTIAALALLALAGCTFDTKHGECIGAFDDPDPALRYSTSGMNVAMGVLFVETIVVPVVVIASCTRCPVGRKAPEAKP
jgi:hypothetical protein